MCSQGMTKEQNYRELMTRLSTAMVVTEAAYSQASPSLSASSP